jgi:hypothetical protein
MKKMTFIAAALIVSAASFSYMGCSGDDNPVSGSGDLMRVARYDAEGYGPDSMYIYSGDDTCGGTDENIQVTVPPLEAIWPALVTGGGPAPECSCTVTEGILEMSLPVSTHSMDDSLGIFETTFSLPAGITDPEMHLKVLADDGAEIYLNGHHIGTASLSGGLWERMISVDSLFMYSEPCPPGGEPCSTIDMVNFLSFNLVNTGTGEYGEPTARADTADCMYVQFEATITWEKAPEVTIDIKPGSDRNPFNCKMKGKGVIPVAILTTEDFDAMNVDCATVRFGPAGAYETHGKCHYEDVDKDGDTDLVFHFRLYETGLTCEDTMGILWGMTLDGIEFEAWDVLSAVPGDCDDCDDDDDDDDDD